MTNLHTKVLLLNVSIKTKLKSLTKELKSSKILLIIIIFVFKLPFQFIDVYKSQNHDFQNSVKLQVQKFSLNLFHKTFVLEKT